MELRIALNCMAIKSELSCSYILNVIFVLNKMFFFGYSFPGNLTFPLPEIEMMVKY